MKKIIYRFSRPTPSFFRRITRKAAFLTIMCMLLLLQPYQLSTSMIMLLACLLSSGITACFICLLTVDTDASFIQWLEGRTKTYQPLFFDKELLK